MLGAAALALTVPFGAAQATAQEVTVQVTAFQVPELTVGLDIWSQSQTDDAALYERLVRLAGLGEAQVVLDQRLVTRSRQRVSSEARSEYIYPTAFEPIEDRFLHVPRTFETRNLGVRIEAEATAGDDSANGLSPILDLGLSVKRVRLKDQLALPLPDLTTGGRVTGTFESPLFLAEEFSTNVRWLMGSRALLLGLSRPADPYDEQPGGAAQQVILTFARASVAGEKPPAQRPETAGGRAPVRTHTLTIRAPVAATAQMLWNHEAAPDEDTQRQLLELVRSGAAHIVFHSAATSNSGSRARIQSIGELIHPTESDGILPTAFETRNVGSDVENETALTSDGRLVTTRTSANQTWPPIWRGLALKPGDSPPELPVPDFRVSNWQAECTLPTGETGLVAAISPRPEENDSGAAPPAWLDVSFVRSVASNRNPAPTTPAADPTDPRTLTSMAVFSVSEEMAVSLQTTAPPVNAPAEATIDAEKTIEIIDALWAATATGQTRLLAFAQVVQDPGRRCRVENGREWRYPSELASTESDRAAFVPTAWRTLQPGTRLEVEVTSGDRSAGGTIKLDFGCPVAEPSFPTAEALRAALDGGTEVPAPTLHESRVAGEFDFALGHPQILAVDRSPAPPGHPEQGRWLVTVLKVAAGR
jgi:hypothetical protein